MGSCYFDRACLRKRRRPQDSATSSWPSVTAWVVDAAEFAQRQFAHARRDACVLVIENADPGTENHDIHATASSDAGCRCEAAAACQLVFPLARRKIVNDYYLRCGNHGQSPQTPARGSTSSRDSRAVVALAATQNPSEITTAAIAKHMPAHTGRLVPAFPEQGGDLAGGDGMGGRAPAGAHRQGSRGHRLALAAMEAIFMSHVEFVIEHPAFRG